MVAGQYELINTKDNGIREIIWNKQIGKRKREPYLFFTKDGKAVPFKG